MSNPTAFQRPRPRQGFTLVEILVVIVIIGILMGIAIPAISRAILTARQTAIRLELSSMERGIENYREKIGDYPPDFSSWAVVQRHYSKAFPRMGANDLALLFTMVHNAGTFDPTRMDRAEALVWALGGFSDNVQRPFTGPGGPLAWIGDGTNQYTDTAVTDADRQDPDNFQINIDRPNAFHEFVPERLNYSTINSSAVITGGNRYLSTDDLDLFLTYTSRENGAPIVYFDSRTYSQFDAFVSDFNGYGSTGFGGVRPYISDKFKPNPTGANFVDDAAAIASWEFVNPNSFQLVSAGMDENFGVLPSFELDSDGYAEPVYFQFRSGRAMAPKTDVDTAGELLFEGVERYQETGIFGGSNNFQPDNITNFSSSTLANDTEG